MKKTIIFLLILLFSSNVFAAKKCGIITMEEGNLVFDEKIEPREGVLFLEKNFKKKIPIWFRFSYEGEDSMDMFDAVFILKDRELTKRKLNNGNDFKINSNKFFSTNKKKKTYIYIKIKPKANTVFKAGEHRIKLHYSINC